MKLNISFSKKHFSDFLKNRSNISIFISLTDKTEIENIISLLDSNKSAGLNSIPTKVLKVLKNDISSKLSEIFNLFLLCCLSFDTKHCLGYPCSLLSDIEEILERLMYNRIYMFFSDKNLIISLKFGFR